MAKAQSPETLLATLDDTLELLRTYGLTAPVSGRVGEPLNSLLDQCEAAVASCQLPAPLRTIHHFACTGGTVLSKVLAAMPNTVLLSEIDPLSKLLDKRFRSNEFAPSDLFAHLQRSIRKVDDGIIITAFVAAVLAAKQSLEQQGIYLVLRDHAHSQFCHKDEDFEQRPTLFEMLRDHVAMRSVISVRHPLDSFLSLQKNNWVHFTPSTLESYSFRYAAFLDRHAGLPIILYEDFIDDAEGVTQYLCVLLGLRYSPFGTQLYSEIELSGDSGRKDGPIAARPRRPVPDDIEAERSESRSYQSLCMRLGYQP